MRIFSGLPNMTPVNKQGQQKMSSTSRRKSNAPSLQGQDGNSVKERPRPLKLSQEEIREKIQAKFGAETKNRQNKLEQQDQPPESSSISNPGEELALKKKQVEDVLRTDSFPFSSKEKDVLQEILQGKSST